MYILQFCNASTHTVIRETIFEDTVQIAKIIKGVEESKSISEPMYIIDQSLRPIEARYVSNSVILHGTDSVYKLFFNINSDKITL